MHLVGGFRGYDADGDEGNETSPGDRIMDAVSYPGFSIPQYQTTLSGDLNANGRDNEDSYHVVWVAGGEVTVDGVYITGGNANAYTMDVPRGPSHGDVGGGIRVEDESDFVLVLTRCFLHGNYGDVGTAVGHGGFGASDLAIEGALIVDECVVDGNISRTIQGSFKEKCAAVGV